ncbi:uncharacterized protein LOC143919180 [Arctopsyche grandis]|uniref:uncharacterized protein LOC143919180 n=1 Tax=Arctopsyche grandis TaxID=121162 RepID=UPI00406D6DD0
MKLFCANSIIFFTLNFHLTVCKEPCIIDVDCYDCLPDYLPEVTSHTAAENLVMASHGDEVTLHCHKTTFKAYPGRSVLKTVCDDGYFKISEETKHISELGCQADYYEDISHEVQFCNNSLQGRSFQYHNALTSNVEHLAEVCYDPEDKRTIFLHMTPHNRNNIEKDQHHDTHNKISMLENFNKMYDISAKVESEQVYYDDVAMNKKMLTLFGKTNFNFADQTLTATKLLSPRFFYNQKRRITNFSSNKVAMWRSIADGNYQNMVLDVASGFCHNSTDVVEIFIGTHEVLTLPTQHGHQEMFLKPGRRYPVPKFIYTIIYNKSQHKALVLVVLNNPFLSISEVRNTVFCPSVCQQVQWLNNLKKNNNFERPNYGLTFCCDMHSFGAVVRDGPNLILNVFAGDRGLLKTSIIA